MWFRLSGSGGSGNSSNDGEATPTTPLNNNNNDNGSNSIIPPFSTSWASSVPAKFEKFRRASFRRKSSTGQTPQNETTTVTTSTPTPSPTITAGSPSLTTSTTFLVPPTPAPRRRSKSPHSILQNEKCREETKEEVDAEIVAVVPQKEKRNSYIGDLFKNEVSILVNNNNNNNKSKKTNKNTMKNLKKKSTTMEALPIIQQPSEPSLLSSIQKLDNNVDITTKAIKTDPPKRKFYRNFVTASTRRQNSDDDGKILKAGKSLQKINDDNGDGEGDGDDVVKPTRNDKFLLEKYNGSCSSIDTVSSDDDDDDDSESSNNDVAVKRTATAKGNLDNLQQRYGVTNGSRSGHGANGVTSTGVGKEKILLTDPKYKNNRIEKSSSKSKISDIEKRESIKRSRSARKITTAHSLAADENGKKQKNVKQKETKDRIHSHLNLQALVKFVVNNKKFLNTDEFAFIRRKSISEAASTVIAVASTCKPMPIVMKYSTDNIVADTPKDNDPKADRNVVLVKKQNLKDSFSLCDRKSNSSNDLDTIDRRESKESGYSGGGSCSVTDSSGKVKRNSSNSSKSSGNFEDEAFYSCDELEMERLRIELQQQQQRQQQQKDEKEQKQRKTSSPSLTSRVAAKINETTNNYKNRKAAAAAAAAASSNKTTTKKRKALANANNLKNKQLQQQLRPELYKQISVERLHSTSIQRQPSDRRPDSAALLRTNGNAMHNSPGIGGNDLLLQGTDGNLGSGIDAAFATALTGNSIGVGGNGVGVGGGGSGADINALDADGKDARRERLHQQHQQNKSAPVSVNRSESYKERLSHKRHRNSRRKTSDPSLTSRPNDDQSDLGLSNSNYPASSNSSLSSGGGSESPSTSMEQVGISATGGVGGISATGTHHASLHGQHHHLHHHPGHGSQHGHGGHMMYQHGHQDSFHGSIGGGSSGSNSTSFWGGSIGGPGGPTMGQLVRQWNFESDEEDDLNETDWSSMVAADVLSALTDAEKKRQEIINEIYQTERSHVRTLKLLERIFFVPLQETGVLSPDHLMLLFPPALLSLRELHGAFEQKLRQRRIEHNHIVQHIGDLLACMFDGQSGDELREFAAQFCARQQIALEALKEKRRKDEQLQKQLSKAESHKACRRLQLKDLLPTVLQRLTKYPLLFENLYKVTVRVVPENTSEAEAIQRALESSKKILVDVNQAVKTAEDAHKLQNIQRKLDKSTLDKEEFKNLDLTQHRLIHDGSLTMKKNPSIQLYGLLFENMIVLLTKQDDKYSLKYLHAARNTEVNNKPVSPIMSIDSEILVRQEAADKNSFFLIKTKTSQMLELRAPSSSECKTWFKHISDAAEQYKPLRSKNANHEPVDDPAIVTLPHSNTKESLELAPERPPPISATATVTTTPLAPLLPPPIVSSTATYNNNVNDAPGVQLRYGRRESTPAGSLEYHHQQQQLQQQQQQQQQQQFNQQQFHKQRLSHNELNPATAAAVNRTMSTRSCGEANINLINEVPNGVTLRHTQSARQANATGVDDETNTKRDSGSIVFSYNPNNTRTLVQATPPLIDPSAVRINVSPVHFAEPALTPVERLRRLDVSIRDGLMEKQKIICDMFRLPVEHFNEIVDIAAMPEAPKDSADIALAAYAQVQTLTEVLNDYMQISPAQEALIAPSVSCDQCQETSVGVSAAKVAKVTDENPDKPPPLPPPNKSQIIKSQAQQQTPAPTATKMLTSSLEEADIHEDDDGYCEIDELRLPSLPQTFASGTSKPKAGSPPPPPLPPPAGSFKTPPTPPPPPSTTAANTAPELVKRQSTISADSIPEESADEVTQAMGDEVITPTITNEQSQKRNSAEREENEKLTGVNEEEIRGNQTQNEKDKEDEESTTTDTTTTVTTATATSSETNTTNTTDVSSGKGDDQEEDDDNDDDDHDDDDDAAGAEVEKTNKYESSTEEKQNAKNEETDANTITSRKDEINSKQSNDAESKAVKEHVATEHIEINDVYDTLATLKKLNTELSMVDSMTQTTLSLTPLNVPNKIYGTKNIVKIDSTIIDNTTTTNNAGNVITNPSVNRLEPSVPCHALNSIVSALNAQISLLLPKISERDIERERLRKENYHLRELLNAMHESQRVEAEKETPNDITVRAKNLTSINNNETNGGTTTIPASAKQVNVAATKTTTTTTIDHLSAVDAD